ncbi:MAG: hypothetical protein R2697_10985 [Ilumatobacteraceae bacterium]
MLDGALATRRVKRWRTSPAVACRKTCCQVLPGAVDAEIRLVVAEGRDD